MLFEAVEPVADRPGRTVFKRFLVILNRIDLLPYLDVDWLHHQRRVERETIFA